MRQLAWWVVLWTGLAVGGCGSDARRPMGEDMSGGDTPSVHDGPGAEPDAGMGPMGSPMGSDGAAWPTGSYTDPACVDGQYTEELPDPQAPIDDVLASFAPGNEHAVIDDLLGRRYPIGQQIVRAGLEHTDFIDCVDAFVGEPRSAADLITRLGTVVHECGHVADLSRGGFDSDHFFVRPGLELECRRGDTTERGGQTFARSRIRGDGLGSARPPCRGAQGGCDFYADVYLDGNPDDGSFDGGDQGFNSLLEETFQYVNSLATGYAFDDQYGRVVSNRDGILTFLWYLGRYLRLARTSYPEAYAMLTGNGCWREAILTAWGRAWLYLDVTEGMPRQGLEDEAIFGLATDSAVLDEIQRVRDAHGC